MAKNTDSAARWLAAMQSGGASKAYIDGINAHTGNPMQAAADAQDRYLTGVQDAVSSGRMRAKLMQTPVSVWKANSVGKGAQRLSSGAAAAADKVRAHFQRFGPVYAQISDTVAAMPKGGMQNALERVRTAISMLKQAAGKSDA